MESVLCGIKAMIFDLDGVIVSTDELHYKAWAAIAAKEKIPFDRTINDRLRGVSRLESLDIILEKAKRTYPQREIEVLAEEKNVIYRQLLAELTPSCVSADVRRTLRLLRSMGFKTAIGSSSRNATLILERTAMTGFFDAVSDGNNIVRSKPDPEVFVKASAMLGTETWTCLVVDDSVAGFEAAHRCGMVACAIGPSCGKGMADIEVDKLSDLLCFVGKEVESYV